MLFIHFSTNHKTMVHVITVKRAQGQRASVIPRGTPIYVSKNDKSKVPMAYHNLKGKSLSQLKFIGVTKAAVNAVSTTYAVIIDGVAKVKIEPLQKLNEKDLVHFDINARTKQSYLKKYPSIMDRIPQSSAMKALASGVAAATVDKLIADGTITATSRGAAVRTASTTAMSLVTGVLKSTARRGSRPDPNKKKIRDSVPLLLNELKKYTYGAVGRVLSVDTKRGDADVRLF